MITCESTVLTLKLNVKMLERYQGYQFVIRRENYVISKLYCKVRNFVLH